MSWSEHKMIKFAILIVKVLCVGPPRMIKRECRQMSSQITPIAFNPPSLPHTRTICWCELHYLRFKLSCFVLKPWNMTTHKIRSNWQLGQINWRTHWLNWGHLELFIWSDFLCKYSKSLLVFLIYRKSIKVKIIPP